MESSDASACLYGSCPDQRLHQAIQDAQEIDLLNTWIPNLEALKHSLLAALHRGARVRFLLLDTNRAWSISQDRSFSISDKDPDIVDKGVQDNLRIISELKYELPDHRKDQVEVKLYDVLPSIAMYRFDRTFFVFMFFKKRIAIEAPAFVFQRDEGAAVTEPFLEEFRLGWETYSTGDVNLNERLGDCPVLRESDETDKKDSHCLMSTVEIDETDKKVSLGLMSTVETVTTCDMCSALTSSVNGREDDSASQFTTMITKDGQEHHVGQLTNKKINPIRLEWRPRTARSPYVFLSHRGVDTKYTIMAPTHWFLKNILCINVFLDAKDSEIGDELLPSLMEHANLCTMAIVVLSPNFRSSAYCVKELNTFMERHQGGELEVLPVLWKIDDVKGYQRELRDINWLKPKTELPSLFLVKELWPSLIKKLCPQRDISEQQLNDYLAEYVRLHCKEGSVPQSLLDFLAHVELAKSAESLANRLWGHLTDSATALFRDLFLVCAVSYVFSSLFSTKSDPSPHTAYG